MVLWWYFLRTGVFYSTAGQIVPLSARSVNCGGHTMFYEIDIRLLVV